MAVGVDERLGGRREDRVRADRGGSEVGSRDRVGRVPGRVVRCAVDEGAASGQRAGVRRVLKVALLRRLATQVDRKRGGAQQDDEPQGDEDEHLALLGAGNASAGHAERVQQVPPHQLTTIVTFAEKPTRFDASAPMSAPMSGTKSGWRYVSCTRSWQPLRGWFVQVAASG